MNRIDKTFKRLKEQKSAAFIPYITAGDPDLKTTESLVYALAEAGADIVELGIPFSDPLADGPTIQRAVQRSLEAGVQVKNILKMVKELRKNTEIPFVFMTYYNIVFNYGIKKFIKDAVSSGADGIIVPDLPMEESEELISESKKKDFCVIMLTAPTTSNARFKKIAEKSRGFIYYVSLTGVTGERQNLATHLKAEVESRKAITEKPVCVGFGVSDAKQAKEVSRFSDGVIIGSAIIKIIEKNLKNKKKIVSEVSLFASKIVKAIKNSK